MPTGADLSVWPEILELSTLGLDHLVEIFHFMARFLRHLPTARYSQLRPDVNVAWVSRAPPHHVNRCFPIRAQA